MLRTVVTMPGWSRKRHVERRGVHRRRRRSRRSSRLLCAPDGAHEQNNRKTGRPPSVLEEPCRTKPGQVRCPSKASCCPTATILPKTPTKSAGCEAGSSRRSRRARASGPWEPARGQGHPRNRDWSPAERHRRNDRTKRQFGLRWTTRTTRHHANPRPGPRPRAARRRAGEPQASSR